MQAQPCIRGRGEGGARVGGNTCWRAARSRPGPATSCALLRALLAAVQGSGRSAVPLTTGPALAVDPFCHPPRQPAPTCATSMKGLRPCRSLQCPSSGVCGQKVGANEIIRMHHTA